jgi:hypothetical protein
MYATLLLAQFFASVTFDHFDCFCVLGLDSTTEGLLQPILSHPKEGTANGIGMLPA